MVAGLVMHFFSPNTMRQRQVHLFEFEVNLIHIASYRPAKAPWRPYLKKRKEKNRSKAYFVSWFQFMVTDYDASGQHR